MKVRRMPYSKNGQKQMSEKFYAVFADHGGIIRRLPLFDNKKASDSAAHKVKELVDLRAANATLSPELSRWVESMTPEIRNRLADYGILNAITAAASKPLREHLDDWKAALLARANSADYVELVTGRARKALTDCGFQYWTDISASKLQSELADMRKDTSVDDRTDRGISAQTSNFYLQAVKQFCRWMLRDGRANASPVTHLQGLNVKTDRRHDRRAFNVDEMLWLLNVTQHGPVRAKMSGAERVLLYRLAAETGLRRGGLAKLTRAGFELDGENPVALVKAGATNKYKNERRVPLKADTAALLRNHLANKMPDAPVFSVPPKDHSAKMVRADLDDARALWLDEATTPAIRLEREGSDFLRYKNSAGQFLDFHSFRHTRGVWLFEHHKAHPREVQELMGVSSLALVDRYTRSFRLTDLSVIERGPDLTLPPTTQSAKATGTDGHSLPRTGLCASVAANATIRSLSPGLSPEGADQRSFMYLGGVSVNPSHPDDESANIVEMPEISPLLTGLVGSATLVGTPRRSGRVVDCAGLENRWARKGPQGSNPCSSAKNTENPGFFRGFLVFWKGLKWGSASGFV